MPASTKACRSQNPGGQRGTGRGPGRKASVMAKYLVDSKAKVDPSWYGLAEAGHWPRELAERGE